MRQHRVWMCLGFVVIGFAAPLSAQTVTAFKTGERTTGMTKQCVWVARHESSDYDCVLQCISEETPHFFPVQLKELPPRELNPQVALKDILDKLDKYGKDLIVAIKYNRKEHFELGPELRLENAPVAQIWLFGGCSPDQSDWFLYGDLTKEPALYPFRYPDPPEGSEVDLGALFPP